jgi:hypothetical protein
MKNCILKNKFQQSLLQRIEIIEKKSKIKCDYIFYIEKICILLKSIFESSSSDQEMAKYKKLPLMKLLEKNLSEEKFFRERKHFKTVNKIVSVKTILAVPCNIIQEEINKALCERPIGDGTYFKANTVEELNEHGDTIALDTLDKRDFSIVDDEIDKSSNKKRNEMKSGFYNSPDIIDLADKHDCKSEIILNTENCQFSFTQGLSQAKAMQKSFHVYSSERICKPVLSIFDSILTQSKKITKIKGDMKTIPEFDEKIFTSQSKNGTFLKPSSTSTSQKMNNNMFQVSKTLSSVKAETSPKHSNINVTSVENNLMTAPAVRKSTNVIFEDLENVDYKIVKERTTTPERVHTKREEGTQETAPLIRSASRTIMSKMSIPNSKFSFKVTPTEIITKSYSITAGKSATIVPPHGCKIIFNHF